MLAHGEDAVATTGRGPRSPGHVPNLIRRKVLWPCDPAKVVRVALENAVSVASVLLLTEATMTEIPEEKKEDSAREAEMAM